MKAKLRAWAFVVTVLGVLTPGLPAAEDPATEEARFLTQIRQLTYEGRRSGEGYFSADGKALIFQSEREAGNPFYQIYLLDLESGDTHRVSPGMGKTTCAFVRPGSDEVLFASTHHDPEALAKQKAELEMRASGKERRYSWDYDETMDVFSARRDGTQLRQLTSARGYDAEAAYSPDGKLIVFCSLRGVYEKGTLSAEDQKRLEMDPAWFGDIYLMNADGSNQRRLTATPGYDGGPFFSPDGQRIIWRRFDDTGAVADIYTMKLDGTDVRRLTQFGSMSWAPYFHPSGEYVIFASNKLGFTNFELYLVDAAGKNEPVRATFTDGFDGLPVFSPDGRKLSWTSNRTSDKASQLFLANWNHEAALAAVRAAPVAARAEAATPRAAASAGLTPEIVAGELRAHVNHLASDALEGRLVGSEGSRLAADYIAARLNEAGLKPFGENDTFFQTFEFNSGVRLVPDANHLSVARRAVGNGAAPASSPDAFQADRDFRPLSFSDNAEVSGEIVFAGYGLTVPGKMGEGYDSYEGLDVKDKIVLVLRYVPEGVEPKRRAELNRYAGLRYKAMIARSHGAKAMLVVTGPNSPNPGEVPALTMDSILAGSNIVAAGISGRVAGALLAGSGKDLKALQTALDLENPHAADVRFVLPDVTLKLATRVERIKKTDRNVLAVLPPNGSGPAEYVMVGAHYDHLGRGETGGFGIKGEENQIHNGADDNASGVAAVLELAATLVKERRERPADFTRGIIFSFWSGEELGLVGSTFFADKPVTPLTQIAAYLNFDMVGRLRDNKLTLQGIGSSSVWKRLIERRNVAAGFNLVLQDDPYLPTDTTPFYPKNVPVLAFFTGSHENYHRPADDTDTLNYEGLERIARFARLITLDLVKEPQRPDYLKVERSSGNTGSRESVRAYLGTIPDYATDITGVKLTGARGGSPADKAGLKAGDIIVEFAGQKIANIYDYTYGLDAVKIGVPVKVVVMRDGQRIEVTITPEARR